ncbi:MAG: Response regulatory protein [Gammaproteobacteria bacterium]|nr:Response regulatory protein [Gammaproteobacteria bacterium]
MNTIRSAKDYYILYVDDEEKSLKYFSRYFSRDYKILTAISTAEARAILDEKATEIGVLISDQRMPVEKGVELLKYSRETYPHIVRLLTTAYSELNDAIEAVNRGEIMRYIPKPWDINFLELEIRQALRYFILNQEREQLRREKLSVIQRVMSFNRAKDLIILSAGMTHIRNAVHAIRACLLQLPENLKVTTGNSFNYDLTQMIKSEIEAILTLATVIQKDIISDNNLKFEPFNIIEKFKAVSGTTPAGIKLISQTDDVTIEANAVLMEKLLQILLEQIYIRTGNGAKHITISRIDSDLQIHIHSGMQFHTLSLLNVPAPLLCLYYICYHHGGSIQTENTTTGTDWKIHLPYRQTDIATPELPSDWQEEIFQRFEVLPE